MVAGWGRVIRIGFAGRQKNKGIDYDPKGRVLTEGCGGVMSRSRKKGPYIDARLSKKVEKAQKTNAREPIKTWARDCTIPPEFVGVTFLVHNGKAFIKVYIDEDMVGHKLGEFSPTRVFKGHSGGKAKAAAPGGK